MIAVQVLSDTVVALYNFNYVEEQSACLILYNILLLKFVYNETACYIFT